MPVNKSCTWRVHWDSKPLIDAYLEEEVSKRASSRKHSDPMGSQEISSPEDIAISTGNSLEDEEFFRPAPPELSQEDILETTRASHQETLKELETDERRASRKFEYLTDHVKKANYSEVYQGRSRFLRAVNAIVYAVQFAFLFLVDKVREWDANREKNQIVDYLVQESSLKSAASQFSWNKPYEERSLEERIACLIEESHLNASLMSVEAGILKQQFLKVSASKMLHILKDYHRGLGEDLCTQLVTELATKHDFEELYIEAARKEIRDPVKIQKLFEQGKSKEEVAEHLLKGCGISQGFNAYDWERPHFSASINYEWEFYKALSQAKLPVSEYRRWIFEDILRIQEKVKDLSFDKQEILESIKVLEKWLTELGRHFEGGISIQEVLSPEFEILAACKEQLKEQFTPRVRLHNLPPLGFDEDTISLESDDEEDMGARSSVVDHLAQRSLSASPAPEKHPVEAPEEETEEEWERSALSEEVDSDSDVDLYNPYLDSGLLTEWDEKHGGPPPQGVRLLPPGVNIATGAPLD